MIFPNLKFLELTEEITLKAQELVEKFDFKPRDALHIATALQNANGIITADKEFTKARKLIKVKII